MTIDATDPSVLFSFIHLRVALVLLTSDNVQHMSSSQNSADVLFTSCGKRFHVIRGFRTVVAHKKKKRAVT